MIVIRSLKSITTTTLSTLPIITKSIYNLSTNPPPSPSPSPTQQQKQYEKLISQQTLKQFESLLNKNTQQSLQKGAQLLGNLQIRVQQNEQKIKYMQQLLQTCSQNTKHLIQKIHIVLQNIKHQNNQILSIQKRAQKQILDCKNFSISSIAKQILDIADALKKSKLSSIDHHKTQDHQVVEAIKNADKQMKNIFQIYGIDQFDPVGKQYDPNRQQALATLPAEKQDMKNKVAYTMRTGFTIKGRLLRSAHVAVYM